MSGRDRVVAVERHTVEGGAEAFGGQSLAHVVETLVGALRAALAGEHPRGILALRLKG
jgi:hypothetical protein